MIPDPDPLTSAVDIAVATLRAAKPLTAMPSTRLDLESAALALEKAMAEKEAGR